MRYLDSLEDACLALAAHPFHARPHRGKIEGMRRYEHRSHVIFFTMEADGIYIGRILHKSRLPRRHVP